ncbi:hypothetical protein [Sodalis sp. RH20]|uniref:hypothetical protein n=1 Tax=unclassified Sodalis (in: enterobacteria) TaxID=2636512 RepID=UPI0039B3EF04
MKTDEEILKAVREGNAVVMFCEPDIASQLAGEAKKHGIDTIYKGKTKVDSENISLVMKSRFMNKNKKEK